MAPNPFFSGRIPKDLHTRIEQYLKETGQSKTQLLVSALASYLDYPVQPSVVSNNFSEDKLFSLEKRVEALEKLILGQAHPAQIDNNISIDNNLDNISDNEEFEERISITNLDNSSDNKTDNETHQATQVVEPTESLSLEDDYEYLGEYHIPGILNFEFEEHEFDISKIKNKLRNANTTKHKTVLIKPYFFKIVGKEEGKKGQLIYSTYRLKAK